MVRCSWQCYANVLKFILICIRRWLFAVEWSYFDNFSRVVGSHVIEDEHAIGYDIQSLEPGNCYFVRVRAGNEHGFATPAASTPPGATPSSQFRLLKAASKNSPPCQVNARRCI